MKCFNCKKSKIILKSIDNRIIFACIRNGDENIYELETMSLEMFLSNPTEFATNLRKFISNVLHKSHPPYHLCSYYIEKEDNKVKIKNIVDLLALIEEEK